MPANKAPSVSVADTSPPPTRPARALLWLIHRYQANVSPGLGVLCRFEPTCSRYAAEAITTHGALRGTWLAVRRLSRCHPGTPLGYDPVPPASPRDRI